MLRLRPRASSRAITTRKARTRRSVTLIPFAITYATRGRTAIAARMISATRHPESDLLLCRRDLRLVVRDLPRCAGARLRGLGEPGSALPAVLTDLPRL